MTLYIYNECVEEVEILIFKLLCLLRQSFSGIWRRENDLSRGKARETTKSHWQQHL